MLSISFFRRLALAVMMAASAASTGGSDAHAAATATDDIYAADPALRRFIDSQHGEAVAIELGRLTYRKRWNEVVDESMYAFALRGTWDDKHPAWAPARAALARALREESVRWLNDNRAEVRLVVNQQSMQGLSEDERQKVTKFFESSAGKVFLRTRETFLRERAYGLPLEIEKDTAEQAKRAHDEAQKVLLGLPEDGDGKVIYDFFHGGPGDKLQKVQVEQWGEIVANVFSNTLEAYVQSHKAELGAVMRAAAPAMPPSSDKTYLGGVAMGSDNAFTVVVEHYDNMRLIGKYTLNYGPADLHWADIALAAPGIKPGEKRWLYRDPAGQLADHP